MEKNTIVEDLFGGKPPSKRINSKKKGQKNETEVAKWLERWTGVKFTRVPRSGGLRWKNNPTVCGDLVCEDKDFNFVFSIETKHLAKVHVTYWLRENSAIFGIWAQCKRDADKAGKIPMALLRENGMAKGEYYVVFPFSLADFNPYSEYSCKGRGDTGDGNIYIYPSDYILKQVNYQTLKTHLQNDTK